MLKNKKIHVWVTNSKLENNNFHCELLIRWLNFYFSTFELLTWSLLILEIQLYLCNIPFGDHQEKTNPFFWLHTESNYLNIIGHCFPSGICYLPENLGLKVELSISMCRKYWLSNWTMVNLIISSKFYFLKLKLLTESIAHMKMAE